MLHPMTFDQAAILVLLVAMLAVFAFDRLRMEVVALGGLAIAALLGLVPASGVFSGFADPAVITVIEILLMVQALGRSAAMEGFSARLSALKLSPAGTIFVLCLAAAGLSVFMNNIGALALMIPVAYGVCGARGIDVRTAIMPISFAALLGGMGSVIGTPANLIVSRQLEEATGRGFGFFDIGVAGLPAALLGLIVITLWAPRLLARRLPPANGDPADERRLLREIVVPEQSPLVGAPLTSLPGTVRSATRAGAHLFIANPALRLEAGDTILLDAPARAMAGIAPDKAPVVQAVVMPESVVIGSAVSTIAAFASRGVGVVALSPQGHRIEGMLGDQRLAIGDVVHLAGEPAAIREALAETELLELAPPAPKATPRGGNMAVIAFAAAVAVSAIGGVRPELAFGAAVLALAAAGAINLRTALAELNWPILIMLAAMIPLGAAVRTTGAAEMMAASLLALIPSDDPAALTAAVLLLGVVVTPFVNNASTALVLGPIALAIASSAGVAPEPLLLAVAIGASTDFLTPFGHHNNTLAMGLAGYRFGDFARAGWPVTLVVVVTATVILSVVYG